MYPKKPTYIESNLWNNSQDTYVSIYVHEETRSTDVYMGMLKCAGDIHMKWHTRINVCGTGLFMYVYTYIGVYIHMKCVPQTFIRVCPAHFICIFPAHFKCCILCARYAALLHNCMHSMQRYCTIHSAKLNMHSYLYATAGFQWMGSTPAGFQETFRADATLDMQRYAQYAELFVCTRCSATICSALLCSAICMHNMQR